MSVLCRYQKLQRGDIQAIYVRCHNSYLLIPPGYWRLLCHRPQPWSAYSAISAHGHAHRVARHRGPAARWHVRYAAPGSVAWELDAPLLARLRQVDPKASESLDFWVSPRRCKENFPCAAVPPEAVWTRWPCDQLTVSVMRQLSRESALDAHLSNHSIHDSIVYGPSAASDLSIYFRGPGDVRGTNTRVWAFGMRL